MFLSSQIRWYFKIIPEKSTHLSWLWKSSWYTGYIENLEFFWTYFTTNKSREKKIRMHEESLSEYVKKIFSTNIW